MRRVNNFWDGQQRFAAFAGGKDEIPWIRVNQRSEGPAKNAVGEDKAVTGRSDSKTGCPPVFLRRKLRQKIIVEAIEILEGHPHQPE